MLAEEGAAEAVPVELIWQAAKLTASLTIYKSARASGVSSYRTRMQVDGIRRYIWTRFAIMLSNTSRSCTASSGPVLHASPLTMHPYNLSA